jgi:hypothetical protein
MECDRAPYKRVTVYHGELFKGSAIDTGLFTENGTIYSNTQCYDTVEAWCNGMIEDVGPPLYLITDTYYGESDTMIRIRNCQDMMFDASSTSH